MSEPGKKLWRGLTEEAQKQLSARDYKAASLAERLRTTGVEAGELVGAETNEAVEKAWIPGIEIFSRTVHAQPYRGTFGEFARRDEGVLHRIGLWPVQWATARMFAHTGKGFHIHPPSIPAGKDPAAWMRQLFVDDPKSYSARPYDKEQWDVMFLVQGVLEVFLRDTRMGLEPRVMRFFVDGDDHRSANNVGIVIPAGGAHALRAEGSTEVIMV